MKINIWRFALGLFIVGLAIFTVRYSRENPYPERATVTNLKVGYYLSEYGWMFSAPIPTSERELQVCGLMQKSRHAELLFTITNPNDKNDFLKLDKSFFDIEPGDFCIRIYLLGNPPPGEYTLWVMDARHSIGELGIEFQESK